MRDIASLHGAPPVPLIGYGLVIGLNKTGDRRQTIFSAQTLANMLERFGVGVPAGEIKIENVAAVLVTAELPAFVRQGARLDVTASSIGDARSLQGGTLIVTPLRGPDGTVHALAQGPLSIGGFGGGRGGNAVHREPPHRRPRAQRRDGAGRPARGDERGQAGAAGAARTGLHATRIGWPTSISEALGGPVARAVDSAHRQRRGPGGVSGGDSGSDGAARVAAASPSTRPRAS